jgi:hypothetical protein
MAFSMVRLNSDDPRHIIWVILLHLGVDDAEKALDCDLDICQKLILSLTVAGDSPDWNKFLEYMRS